MISKMSEPAPTPVTDEDVRAALLADKGSQVTLVSWSLEDLAHSYDGFTSNMKNIKVKYSSGEGNSPQEVCYAMKANRHSGEDSNSFLGLIFAKEAGYYKEVIPALNAVLEEIGVSPLSFPKCYFSRLETGKEVIILENLKDQGYGMESKALGVGIDHASLVLKELAKLHAASALLQAKNPKEDLLERFQCLQKEWTEEFNIGGDFNSFVGGFLDIGIAMFEKIGGCEKVVRWIKKIKPDAWKIFRELLVREPPFTYILHGDCWINNMLFRYDDNKHPVEVKFFDLQGCRKASLALDLHQFLNLNLAGPVRRPNLPSLLSRYHKAFDDVMKAGGSEVPFTLEELHQEYIRKGAYGVLYGIMWLPNMVRRPEDHHELLSTEDNTNSQLKNVLRMVDDNPLLKPRIMSVIDEWSECGVIS